MANEETNRSAQSVSLNSRRFNESCFTAFRNSAERITNSTTDVLMLYLPYRLRSYITQSSQYANKARKQEGPAAGSFYQLQSPNRLVRLPPPLNRHFRC